MKKTLGQVALFIIITLGSLKAYSQTEKEYDDDGWEFIGKSASGSKYYMEALAAYTTKEDVFGIKKIWVKVIESKTILKRKGKKYTYYNTKNMLLYEFNCKNKELREIQYAVYNSKGDLLDSGNSYGESSTVIPGSMGETIFRAGCK